MSRLCALPVTLALAVCGTGSPSLAQTLDAMPLAGGIQATITDLPQERLQALAVGGVEVLRAPSITVELQLIDARGQAAGIIVQAASPDPACAAAPYALTLQFGAPWLRGPLGQHCTPYFTSGYPGGAVLVSAPQLHQDGDALIFDI